MATPLEIILRSAFQADGVNEAIHAFSEVRQHLRLLQAETQAIGQLQPFNAEDFLGGGNFTAQIDERITKIRLLQDTLKEAGSAAVVTGNQMAAVQFGQQISDLDREIGLLKQLRQGFKETGDEAEQFTEKIQKQAQPVSRTSGGITGLIGKFNELAFSIFITQSSILTFIGIFGDVFEKIEAGAASMDKFNASAILVTRAGGNFQTLTSNLESASQGAVKLDTALSGVIQLSKAGFPELAESADDLLRIAVNSAKLSGELDQVETIYRKLIKGIVKGSPLLIDDADLLIKIGDANEKLAAATGRTVEQLSARDRVLATHTAVIEEGKRINELAENVDSSSLSFAQLRTSVGEFLNTLGAGSVVAFTETMKGGAEGSNAVKQALLEIGKNSPTFLRFLEMMEEHFGTAREAGISFGATLVHLGVGIGQSFERMSQHVADNIEYIGNTYEALIALIKEPTAENLRQLSVAINDLPPIFEKSEEAGRSFFDRIIGSSPEARQAAADFIDTMHGINDEVAQFDPQPWLDGIDRIAQKANEVEFGMAFDKFREQLDDILNPSVQSIFSDKVSDLFDQQTEAIEKAYERRNDSIQKAQDRLAESITDAQDRLADKLRDAERKLSDALQDINEDLADKLNDISEDSASSREKAHKDTTKKIEDIEEKHQKKLEDIQRKYEASRLKALIDRDARGLFEAEQARKDAIEAANKDAQDSKQSELEDMQDKLDEINKKEEQRRKDAQDAAEKRRRDAQEAAEDERRDAQEAYNDLLADAKKAYEKSRLEAEKALNEQRRDAQESYNERVGDLEEWFQDELQVRAAKEAEKKLNELRQQAESEQYTRDHLERLLQMYSDYLQERNNLINTQPPPIPSDGGTGGTDNGGTSGGSGGTGNGVVLPGFPCNYPPSIIRPGADGNLYNCVNGIWTRFNGIPSGGGGGGGGANFTAGTQGGGQRVTIAFKGEGQSGKALADLMKEFAYEAIIEAMG